MTKRPHICYLTFLDFPQEVANRVQIATVADTFSRIVPTWLVVWHLYVSRDEMRRIYALGNQLRLLTISQKRLWHSIEKVKCLAFVLYIAYIVRPHHTIVREERLASILARLHVRYSFELHDISSRNVKSLPLIMSRSELTISISHGLTSSLKRLGFKRYPLAVLPCGVPFDRFNRRELTDDIRISHGSPKIIYAGRFSLWKGVDTLIRALAFLPQGSHLYLIGGYPGEEKWLEQCAIDCGAKDQITIIPHIPYSQVPSYLHTADVLVIPNSGCMVISTEYTSPLKLFEFLATGLPVVASDLPSMRRLVEDDMVWFVPPDDPRALADGIIKAKKEDNQSLRRRRLELAAQHSWSRRCQKTLRLLSYRRCSNHQRLDIRKAQL